jgi:hypothetical protein
MDWKQQVDAFKKDMTLEAPVISTQAIRLAFFGGVGGGKSVTAGIAAVGITPKGLIGWIDGEGHRSGWAIDIVATMAAQRYGGTKADWVARFKVLHLDPPFNPLRVVAAVDVLEQAGCKTIVPDCMTQAWDSDGGYLDLKSDEVEKMLKANPNTSEAKVASSAAAHVKPWTHGKLVSKITSSKCNVIMLFQAKQKYNAKTFKPDDFESPIQESGLTRTALAVGRVQQNEKGEGGYCYFTLPLAQGTKTTHPDIAAAMPKNGEQFKFEHAEKLLALCGGEARETAKPTTKPITGAKDLKAALKKELHDLLKPIHQGDMAVMRQWLVDEACIDPAVPLADLSEKELSAALVMARKKMPRPDVGS